MSILVGPRHFSGMKRAFDSSPLGLSAVIRGLAIDNARLKLEVSGVTDFTDSSTGTASTLTPATFVDLAIALSGVFNAVTAGGVSATAFNTSVGKLNNAHAVIGTQLNLAFSKLGLSLVTGLATGTVAAAGTIPALDKAATTANGTSSVDYTSYVAVTNILKSNHRKLMAGVDTVLVAMGATSVTMGLTGIYSQDEGLVAPGAVATAFDGSSSVALADATAFLLGAANNVATAAAAWNAVMLQADNFPLSVVAGR